MRHKTQEQVETQPNDVERAGSMAAATDYDTRVRPDEARPAASPVDIRKFLGFLVKYWWVPALTSILSLLAAVAYLSKASPEFVSRASIWEAEKLRLPDGALFTGDVQNYLGTQAELLRSGALEQLALARLQASETNAAPDDAQKTHFRVKLNITPVPKTTILMIEAASPNAAFSQAYLGALLTEFLDYKKNLKRTASGDTLASISEQVLRLEKELKAEQESLTAFEQTNNLDILKVEGSTAGGYLAKLDTQLSDSRLELKLIEANASEEKAGRVEGARALISSGPAGEDVVTPSGLRSPEHQAAAREVELLNLERDKLSKFLRPKHPKIVKLDAEIARAQKLNDLFRLQSTRQLEASRESLKLKISALEASVQEWEAKVMRANTRIAEAERLKLNVNRIQVVYDRLVGLLQSIDISRNIDQESLAILQPASPAVISRKQEKSKAMMIILGGVGMGLGIVFLISWRDDQLRSMSDVSARFGDVIVGQLPEMPPLKGETVLPLLQAQDDRQTYVESYRSLRSALFFMPNPGERPKILLITSAMPNEGKSTIAANLARTLALGGSRVLLIDADLRRGQLHKLMGLRSEPGFSDLLQHPEDLETIVQSNCLPNLSFISCGSNVGHPGDLFLRPSLELVLNRFREKFDHVIIDTSPIFAADDTTTLAPQVDGALFVVRSRFSRSGPVRQAIELLCRRQVRMLGVVVNGADASAHSYYYYKNTGYYNLPDAGASTPGKGPV